MSKDGELTEVDHGQSISYDVSKLVDFPGFNISAPPSVKDVSLLEISLLAIIRVQAYRSLPPLVDLYKQHFPPDF